MNLFVEKYVQSGQVAVKLMRGQGVEDIRSDDEDEDPKLLGDWNRRSSFLFQWRAHHESFIIIYHGFLMETIQVAYDSDMIEYRITYFCYNKTGIVHGAKKIQWLGPPSFVHIKTFQNFEVTSPTFRKKNWEVLFLNMAIPQICSALWKAFCEDLMARQKCVSRVWKFTGKGWTMFEMHGFQKRSSAFESVEDEQLSANP